MSFLFCEFAAIHNPMKDKHNIVSFIKVISSRLPKLLFFNAVLDRIYIDPTIPVDVGEG